MLKNIEQLNKARQEKREKGKNIEIVLVYIRHGLRDPKDNSLTDIGREETKKIAEQLGLKGKFNIIKPYGSTVGPHENVEVESIASKRDWKMGRSLETATIFAETVLDENQDIYNPRPVDSVNYEEFKIPRPYNHKKIYDSFIQKNYDKLSDEEKKSAAKYAQKKTIEHLMSLDSPEAINFKTEVAGGYALPLVHFSEMSKRLNPNQTILIPLGVHGGHMELLLQQAMVQENKDGKKSIGFKSLDEIGGEMDSSEGYSIKINRDENGELQNYILTFFNQEKRPAGEFVLDAEKIKELADFYKELHKEDLSLLQKISEDQKKENN